jgi:hypothetical protein
VVAEIDAHAAEASVRGVETRRVLDGQRVALEITTDLGL